jgi:hypothetical protein
MPGTVGERGALTHGSSKFQMPDSSGLELRIPDSRFGVNKGAAGKVSVLSVS